MSIQNSTDASAAKGRKMFLLLALIFVLPFTIAFTMHVLDIRPSGKSVGQLVAPVVELKMPAFDDVQGATFAAERWNKVWNIVMVSDNNCTVACEESIDKLNRVHRTFYKDIDRMQRILILKNEVDAKRIAKLQEKFPKLIILAAKEANQLAFVAQFDQLGNDENIYLVDPLNNLMMYYPQDVEPKGLRKDIKKLLKGSWNG